MTTHPTKRRLSTSLACVLAVCVSLGPGCFIGCPLAAISGEPYGMTIDDWRSIRGKKGGIWADAPVFAAMDLPLAFALDTGFLPISLIMWGLLSLGEGGTDEDDPEEDEPREAPHGDVGRDSEARQDRWNQRATD